MVRVAHVEDLVEGGGRAPRGAPGRAQAPRARLPRQGPRRERPEGQQRVEQLHHLDLAPHPAERLRPLAQPVEVEVGVLRGRPGRRRVLVQLEDLRDLLLQLLRLLGQLVEVVVDGEVQVLPWR